MSKFSKLVRVFKANELLLNSMRGNIDFSEHGVAVLGEVINEEVAKEAAKALFECFTMNGRVFTDGEEDIKAGSKYCFSAPEYSDSLLSAAKNLAKLGIVNMEKIKQPHPFLEVEGIKLFMGVSSSWVETAEGTFSIPSNAIKYIDGIVIRTESMKRAIEEFDATLALLEEEARKKYEEMGETREREQYFADRSHYVLRHLPTPGICLKTANAKIRINEQQTIVVTKHRITTTGAARRLKLYRRALLVVYSDTPNETVEEIKEIAPSVKVILLPSEEKRKEKKTIRDLNGKMMTHYHNYIRRLIGNSVLLDGAITHCSLEQIKEALVHSGVRSDEVAVLPPKARPRKGAIDISVSFKSLHDTAPISVLRILHEIDTAKSNYEVWNYLAQRKWAIQNKEWRLLAEDAGIALALYKLGYRSRIEDCPKRTFPDQVILAASYKVDLSCHRWLTDF